MDHEADLQQAPIAQLDRASGFEPEGREFESLWVRNAFLPEKASLFLIDNE